MREVSYTDADGRRWRTMIPDDAPDYEAEIGLPAGPPSLESLELPLDIEVRLHNQLFARRLFTREDLRNRESEISAALMAALKVDAVSIRALYEP